MHGQAGYTCPKPSRRGSHSMAGEGGGRLGFARSRKAKMLIKLLETSPEKQCPEGALQNHASFLPLGCLYPRDLGGRWSLHIVFFLFFCTSIPTVK